MNDFFNREKRPFLVILDGRFLPVEDLSVSVDRETEKVHTMGGGVAGNRTTGQQLRLKFTTRRNPMMRNHAHITEQILIYNDDQCLELGHIQEANYGMSVEFGNSYELEFTALDWKLRDR